MFLGFILTNITVIDPFDSNPLILKTIQNIKTNQQFEQQMQKTPERTHSRLRAYVSIARPDHWFKNIFMLPGIILALLVGDTEFNTMVLVKILTAILVTCLLASANYTINEWLDAEYDRHHPVKSKRPSVTGSISSQFVYLQWFILSTIGISLSLYVSYTFTVFAAILLFMGIVYNVRPLRVKDRPFLDVLSEAVNNPLRFILGWCAVVDTILPPSSILLAYWMGGAFLMAVKRYAEYRYIDDPRRAGLYRKSFMYYNENNLLLSSFFYALTTAFLLGVFLIKYRVEYIISFPFLAILFVWYLRLGMMTNSIVQNPEKLYTARGFLAYIVFLVLLISGLSIIDIPSLNVLLEPFTSLVLNN